MIIIFIYKTSREIKMCPSPFESHFRMALITNVRVVKGKCTLAF